MKFEAWYGTVQGLPDKHWPPQLQHQHHESKHACALRPLHTHFMLRENDFEKQMDVCKLWCKFPIEIFIKDGHDIPIQRTGKVRMDEQQFHDQLSWAKSHQRAFALQIPNVDYLYKKCQRQKKERANLAKAQRLKKLSQLPLAFGSIERLSTDFVSSQKISALLQPGKQFAPDLCHQLQAQRAASSHDLTQSVFCRGDRKLSSLELYRERECVKIRISFSSFINSSRFRIKTPASSPVWDLSPPCFTCSTSLEYIFQHLSTSFTSFAWLILSPFKGQAKAHRWDAGQMVLIQRPVVQVTCWANIEHSRNPISPNIAVQGLASNNPVSGSSPSSGQHIQRTQDPKAEPGCKTNGN